MVHTCISESSEEELQSYKQKPIWTYAKILTVARGGTIVRVKAGGHSTYNDINILKTFEFSSSD